MKSDNTIQNVCVGGGRESYIDTLKLFSIFIVYLTHFIAYFHSEYFYLWTRSPFSIFLNGVTGKLGVAFFSVCVGYFAFLSKEMNPLFYIIRRYFYFVVCGFVINLVFAIGKGNLSLKVISESLLLGSGIFPTYWCIQSFFIGSVISYFNSYYKIQDAFIILEIIIFYSLGKTWIAICLLGNLTVLFSRDDTFENILKRKAVKIFLLLLIFLLIKRSESELTYLIDGIGSLIFLLVVKNSDFLKRIFGTRFFAAQGKNVMAIYLFHTCFFIKGGKLFFNILSFLPYKVQFVLVLVLCWIALILFSYPMNWILNKILSVFTSKMRPYFNKQTK